MHGLYGADLVCACPMLARIAIRNKLNVILTESTVLFDLMDCMVFRGVSDLYSGGEFTACFAICVMVIIPFACFYFSVCWFVFVINQFAKLFDC